MLTLTEAEVRDALRDCYDPELPCNLVDLGVVRAIRVTPDKSAPGSGIPGVPQKHAVEVELAPATRGEAAEAQLTAQIRNRLAGIERVSWTETILLDEPLWSPLDLSPAGRQALGLDGNRNLIQIR